MLLLLSTTYKGTKKSSPWPESDPKVSTLHGTAPLSYPEILWALFSVNCTMFKMLRFIHFVIGLYLFMSFEKASYFPFWYTTGLVAVDLESIYVKLIFAKQPPLVLHTR